MNRRCADCGGSITRKSMSGLCRVCVANSPVTRSKMADVQRARWKKEGVVRKVCKVCGRGISRGNMSMLCLAHFMADPEQRSLRKSHSKHLNRASPKWKLPVEQHDEYHRLVRTNHKARDVYEHLANGVPLPVRAYKYAKVDLASVKQVTDLVADTMKICAKDLVGDSQFRIHVDGRAVLCMVLRQKRRLSFPQIGSAIGRDHSSVYNLVRNFDRRLEARPELGGVMRRVMELAA